MADKASILERRSRTSSSAERAGLYEPGNAFQSYQPQAKIDVASARQMIDILTLLHEKNRAI